jgi:hypothetical protein
MGMAVMRVDDEADAAQLRAAAAQAAAGLRADAPTVAMIHGFRYDPTAPCADPHGSIYRDGPTPPALANGGRAASWPHALGYTGAGAADALCVGFGWRARAAHLGGYLREGRSGFAAVCDRAAQAGRTLARAAVALAEVRDRPVDVLAHSLGARVALAALRAAAEEGMGAPFGRVILMGPAAFAAEARAALAACDRAGAPAPEVYCLLARGNAAFDRLFEAFAPYGHGPSLGRSGLGARRARWIDLAFDAPATADWAAARGVPLAPAAGFPCHWSFYTRPGAMALHRAILRREPGFGVEEMRADGVPQHAPARRRRWLREGGPSEDLAPTPA